MRFSARGLEVVLPERRKVSQEKIDQFLEEKKLWIIRVKKRMLDTPPAPALSLPTDITLHAIHKKWTVIYLSTLNSRTVQLSDSHHEIKLWGKTDDKKRCITALKTWLKKIAEQYLNEQLHELAKKNQFYFSGLTIRQTISRWGSCSPKKSISLCCNLLFLPPELVIHVLLHELCHTKYMHHKRSFWKLLEKHDPDMVMHKNQLREAGKKIPAWAGRIVDD